MEQTPHLQDVAPRLEPTTALARYDAACRALAEASSLDEVKDVRDKMMALRAYARQAGNRQLELDALRIRLRAERKLGELIAAMPKNKGTLRRGSEMEPTDETPTLEDARIGKGMADRARKLARVPESEFEALLESRPDRVDHHLKLRTREDRHKAVAEKARLVIYENRVFSLIYADPPWRFETHSESGKDRRSADNHYPCMTFEAIAALQYGDRSICRIAADDAVMFMWVTPPMLEHGLAVSKAWGFQYKSHLVWVKDQAGTGYWVRQRHEPLLICTRGNPHTPLGVPPSVISGRRGDHSAKPPEVRALLESMFPHFDETTRIELFARGRSPGWTVHGYEAEPGGAS